MLEKVKHNGHDGGWMELTLMQHWVMTHLLYKYLLALPDDDDHWHEWEYIDKIICQEGQETHGSMMTELAMYCVKAVVNNTALPCQLGKLFDMANILPNGTTYSLLLWYLQELWPDLNIIDDTSIQDGTPLYRSKAACPVTYIWKDGIHYGSSINMHSGWLICFHF